MCFLVVCVCVVYFFTPQFVITAGEYKNQPVYYGNKKSNKVALMFNCYEERENIEKIAEILEKYNFKATFFFGGCFADDNEKLLNKLVEKGHEIANHGYFHKSHSKLNYESNIREIKNTEAVICALCGVKTSLFAPPSGDFSDKTLKACEELQYKVIMWSKDTIDWRDKDEKIVYNRATNDVSGGDFVLMHPKDCTVKALPEIIENYIDRGLVVSTVSECME